MSEQFTYCSNTRLSCPHFRTRAFHIPVNLQECHPIFITNSTNDRSAKRLNLNGDLNIFYGFQIPGFDILKTGLAGPILASLAYKFVPLKPVIFYFVPDRNSVFVHQAVSNPLFSIGSQNKNALKIKGVIARSG